MEFKTSLMNKIKKINECLGEYISPKNISQSKLYDSMAYSLFAGGKRLRPVIMMAVCELFEKDEDICMPFAVAMEMIHTYSLIHDDLPAMDDDSLRRGKPTSHIKFGEATAILAGDALLNKAFEVVSAYDIADVCKKNVLRAINTLAISSGSEGMIGGQIKDMDSEGQSITLEELQSIHSLKTGAIISSSAKIGAILSGANEDEIVAVEDFARNLGIAFQIQDDILDVMGDEKSLGKHTGSDAKSEKNTYVALCGLEKSHELVEEYSSKAINSLAIFGECGEFLIKLTEYLILRQS